MLAATGRATTTTSHGTSRGSSGRRASRNARRTRFRTTAPPTRRLTRKPTLGSSGFSRAKWYRTNSGRVTRRPSRSTVWKRERERRRFSLRTSPRGLTRPRGAAGPSHGAGGSPRDRRGCACAYGNRGDVGDVGCVVGTSSSCLRSHGLGGKHAGYQTAVQDRARARLFDWRATPREPLTRLAAR